MKSHKAFTLIELLVVISIIALLVSILMPALSNARQQATGAVCLANQKTMALAWTMYYDDNDDRIPWANSSDWNNIKPWSYYSSDVGLAPKYESIRNGSLYPYIETIEAYHCPGDKRYNKPSADTSDDLGVMGGYRSYSIPCGLFGTLPSGGAGIIPHVKASSIKRPSEKYVFIEEMDGRGGNIGSWLLYLDEEGWSDPLAIWHNDASTLGFCDGHGEMHHWVDKSTFDMSEQQISGFPIDSGEGEDLEYMKKGYAHKGLQ